MSAAQKSAPPTRSWHAQWCFFDKLIPLPWNTFAYFRRLVELQGEPTRAVVRVSADARYTLYVNGVRVHHGPARSFPQFQSYDELDLTRLLHSGGNTICAIVHQFGVPTFQSQYRDCSGFLLDGEIEAGGQTTAIHTPEDWLVREARGWRKNVARLSVQLGFQEHFDADADPADWMSPGFVPREEDGWKKPYVMGPAGTHPWIYMEPRIAPLLADHVEHFSAVMAQFKGENARGYKVADDVYHLPNGEKREKETALIDDAAAMLREDDSVATINPPADGEFVAAVIDVGNYRTGHFMLDIAEAAGDEIIDILYAENLDKAGFVVIVNDPWSQPATADRYRCKPGPQSWETFLFRGMRYVALIFRNVEKPLKIRRVAVRQVNASVEEIGSFACSDEMLNRIWQVGRETQRNCLFDAFVDCPWREQAQWWGDARVQAQVTAHAFGDLCVFERGIRQMMQSQGLDGSLHSHPPADVPGHRLPTFMMTWVGTIHDHYLQTGRTDLISECLPAMHRLFDFFRTHETRDGMVDHFAGWWVFLDWCPLYNEDFGAVLNLMYLQATRKASELCRLVGDEASEARYTKQAERLTASIEKYFWDEKQQLWLDGWDAKTETPVQEISQHANALAILLDLKPLTHKKIATDVLLKSARSKRTKIITGSPFFYAYILEALAKTGFHEDVVKIIREKWGEMIEAGAATCWEGWDGLQSRCHAWSASPVYHLMQQVLGVVSTEPGWRHVTIRPTPLGLDYARGVVPTLHGPIRVEWEKVEDDQLAVRVDLPEGITGTFIGPLGESRSLESGGQEFHT